MKRDRHVAEPGMAQAQRHHFEYDAHRLCRTCAQVLGGILDHQRQLMAAAHNWGEVAGVRVGTLYQYFAHRDAIIDALQYREFERSSAMLELVLRNSENVSDREVAQAVLAELLRSYRAAPALHRVLAVDGLRYSTPERVLAFDVRSVALVRAFLAMAGPRIRSTNLEAAAFIVYQSVRATMLAYLLENPAGVPDQVVVAELTELIVRYLAA